MHNPQHIRNLLNANPATARLYLAANAFAIDRGHPDQLPPEAVHDDDLRSRIEHAIARRVRRPAPATLRILTAPRPMAGEA